MHSVTPTVSETLPENSGMSGLACHTKRGVTTPTSGRFFYVPTLTPKEKTMRWIFNKLRKLLNRPEQSIVQKSELDNEQLFKRFKEYWNDKAEEINKAK